MLPGWLKFVLIIFILALGGFTWISYQQQKQWEKFNSTVVWLEKNKTYSCEVGKIYPSQCSFECFDIYTATRYLLVPDDCEVLKTKLKEGKVIKFQPVANYNPDGSLKVKILP
jgi:hypothetical protein